MRILVQNSKNMATHGKLIIWPEIKGIGLKGIYLTIENIRNWETNAEFENYSRIIVHQTNNLLTKHSDIKDIQALKGFRQLHDDTERQNLTIVPSPESLQELIEKKSNISRINLFVDIYNTISIKFNLALGAHDWDRIDGNVHLRYTDGTEKFSSGAEKELKAVQAGEFSYIDDSNEIISQLELIQNDKTKVTLDTNNVFIIVQGNRHTPFPHLENAVSELLFLIKKYCGGNVKVEGQIEDLFYDYQI